MSRSLLDINVVIALLDPDHAFHERAHAWWAEHGTKGWASCPITENGVVRIMSHPSYSPRVTFPPGDLIDRLRRFAKHSDHAFWPDDVSIVNPALVVADRVHGARQITDLYLLALAVRHRGRFATFDRSVPLSSVVGASPKHLVVL